MILSANRQRNQELRPELHVAICGAFDAGESKHLIAKRFGVSRTAVYTTLDRFALTGNFTSLPR